METGNEILNKFVKDCANNRAKILEDFTKAYIADRVIEKGWNPNRMRLVEKRDLSNGKVEYWFEQKRGRDKK